MGRKGIAFGILACVCVLLSGCGAGVASYDRAMELAKAGDYQQAADYLKKAIDENDERAEFYIGYGMVLTEMGQPEQALKQFKRAYQDADNSIANANNKQVYYGRAIAYYNLGRYDESLQACEDALKLSEPVSLDSNILCSKGVVLEGMGEQDQALKMYKKAIEKDSKNWDAYMKKGALEEKLNIVEEAGREYQKVIDGASKEKFEAYFRLYALYLDYGQDSAADKLLKEMIALKDKDAFALCQKGWAYHCCGDEEKAASLLGDSLQKGYLGASYYLGMLEMAASRVDYEHAREYFQGYIDAGEISYRAQAYNQLGWCAMEQKDYEGAQQYFENGLKTADASSRQILWKNQIILLEKRGLFADAKQQAEEYLVLYGQDQKMQREYSFLKTRVSRQPVTATGSAIGAAGSGADGDDQAGTTQEPLSDTGREDRTAVPPTASSDGTTYPPASATEPVQTAGTASTLPVGSAEATPDESNGIEDSDEEAGMAGYVETLE